MAGRTPDPALPAAARKAPPRTQPSRRKYPARLNGNVRAACPARQYQITQTLTATSRFAARAWIRGVGPLSGDRREFDTEVPQDEYYSPGRVDAPPLQGRWMSPEEDS